MDADGGEVSIPSLQVTTGSLSFYCQTLGRSAGFLSVVYWWWQWSGRASRSLPPGDRNCALKASATSMISARGCRRSFGWLKPLHQILLPLRFPPGHGCSSETTRIYVAICDYLNQDAVCIAITRWVRSFFQNVRRFDGGFQFDKSLRIERYCWFCHSFCGTYLKATLRNLADTFAIDDPSSWVSLHHKYLTIYDQEVECFSLFSTVINALISIYSHTLRSVLNHGRMFINTKLFLHSDGSSRLFFICLVALFVLTQIFSLCI